MRRGRGKAGGVVSLGNDGIAVDVDRLDGGTGAPRAGDGRPWGPAARLLAAVAATVAVGASLLLFRSLLPPSVRVHDLVTRSSVAPSVSGPLGSRRLPSLLSPVTAMADELEDLEAEATDIRNQLSQAKDDYLGAVQRQSEAAAAAQGARDELADIQARLDAQQDSLARVVRAQYMSTVDMRILTLMTSSETMEGLTGTIDYLDHVEGKKVTATSEVLQLRDEQAEVLSLLEETERLATEAADESARLQAELESRKEEMRPRIDALMGEVKARLGSSSGSTQLHEALSFLEGVQGMGDTQEAIVRSAYSTGYAGYSMCEAWAEYVYENAGVPIGSFGSAYSSYAAYCESTDYNEMPVGALAYGSGTSGPYSHVGICVFNGGGGPDTIYIMDNEGSRQGKAVTLTDWLKWQTAVSWNNGETGWFGWGVPYGVTLA